MRKLPVIAILLSTALVTALGVAQQPGTVTLLCSPDQAWCEAIPSAFERATGLRLEFVRLSSGEALARLRAERARPTFDVWFGGTGDPHLVAAAERLTEFHRSPRYDEIHENLRQAVADVYIPLYAGILGWAVNEGLLRQRGLPLPRTWQDLGNPAYRGLVATPNPNTSGTAYTMLATLVQIYGEPEAFALLARIHQNVAQYTRSGAAPGLLAGRGEVAVGVTFLHDAVTQAVRGFPITPTAPADGTGYEIGGISLVRGGPNPEGARRFIDWALSPEAQRIAAETNSFQIQSNRATPVPPASPRFEDINVIPYDFERWGTPAVRDRLVQRWTREIFPIRRR